MSLPYTTNVPLIGMTLGVSRPIINTNFQSINSLVDVNHYTFSSTQAGKHNFLNLPNTASKPSVSTLESGFYASALPTSGVSNLIWQMRSPKNTQVVLTNEVGVSATSNGWSFLPGGLMIQWGHNTITSGAGGTPISFSPAFSGTPYIFVISSTVTGSEVVTSVSYFNLVAGGVSAKCSSNGIVCKWVAIGPK